MYIKIHVNSDIQIDRWITFRFYLDSERIYIVF